MAATALPHSRDGRFEVVSSTWDHNGSHDVTVRDHAPLAGPSDAAARERARRTARRSDPYPGDVRWTRLDLERVVETDQGPRREFAFTVSRLDSSYR